MAEVAGVRVVERALIAKLRDRDDLALAHRHAQERDDVRVGDLGPDGDLVPYLSGHGSCRVDARDSPLIVDAQGA